MSPQQFDALVAGFYRAATGEVSWGSALRPVQEAFGARLAVLQTIDMQRDGRLSALAYGDGEEWAADAVLHYVRDWHPLDPRRQRFLAEGPAALGQWRHCHEAFDDQFVQHDRFFQEYLTAYGARYNANVVLPVAEGLVSAFVLELPAQRGPLSAAERNHAERLGRHMQDALRAHERVRALAVQALAGQGLLEDFSFPIWLLDSDRFVWHANAAGREKLSRDGLLALQSKRLVARHSQADRDLVQTLQLLTSRGHGARARIGLHRPGAEPMAWLLLHAMAPDRVLGAFGDRPMVMATLLDVGARHALNPAVLAEVFAMTPAQARVAAMLADGATAPEIAAVLGCALSTVRTHLRQVMARLGARRLTDAVRLLRQGDSLWSLAAEART